MEAVLKHSRQRDAIKNLLKDVACHPSAEWIYENVKKDFPKISLATVYRNLNLLCDTGEAVRIDVGDGTVRYDGYVKNHYHFLCSKCRRVIDVSEDEISHINSEIEKKHGVSVERHSIVFFGKCNECKK